MMKPLSQVMVEQAYLQIRVPRAEPIREGQRGHFADHERLENAVTSLLAGAR